MNQQRSPINVFENIDAPGAGSPETVDGSTLRDFVRTVWRRKWVLIGFVASVTLLTWLYVQQIKPVYTSSATLIVETRQTRVVNIDQVMSGLNGRLQDVVRGEVEVLKSRNLAVRVIKELALDGDPDFNLALRPPKPPGVLALLNPIQYLPPAWLELLDFSSATEQFPPRDESQLELDGIQVKLIRRLQRGLKIKRVEFSPVLVVEFTSDSPVMAKTVANGVANAYLTSQLEAKFQAVERATGWLNERLRELKNNVELAETAVENYRKKKGLIKTTGPTLSDQQLSELNTQLILARGSRAEAETRLRQARSQIKAAGNQQSFSEILNSVVIQSLRAEELGLRRKLSELSNRYGEKHPKIINARSEMEEIVGKIELQARKIVESLANEVSVARSREATLRKTVDNLKRKVSGQSEAGIELRSLVREAEASKALYETFLARFKETTTQRDLQGADARIISAAVLPSWPSAPRKSIIYISTLVAAVFFGMFAIYILEEFDTGFRSTNQMEAVLGFPCLGLVPEVTRGGFLRAGILDQVRKSPTSSFAEAIRSLRTSLSIANEASKEPRVILVTSTEPSEGKSLIAYMIAALGAMSRDQKVILIDADLRRPDVHKLAEVDVSPGLAEHLTGDVELEAIVRMDERFSLDYIAAGKPTGNAGDIVESQGLRDLIATLREKYDLVVVDTPPVMAVSDSRRLASIADRVVFLVRWAHTRRETVRAAAEMIARAKPGGVVTVLNRVDVRKHAKYGYGDSGSYYGYHRRYYVS